MRRNQESSEQTESLKPVVWIVSAYEDLKEFSPKVQREVGYALDKAQRGGKSDKAKVLLGFDGAGVLEIVENFQGDAYRAVYTVRLAGVIYVLHCFQKKSKVGIKTTKQDMDLIKQRLREAEALHANRKEEK